MKKYLGAFLILFSLIFTQSLYAASFDPKIKWETIKTEHFVVNYPKEIQSVAFDMARILEEAYAKLSPELNWKPWGRTEIVVTDASDESNALATVLPYNIIYFRIAPPPPDSSLANYDNYLKMLVTHELTHIIHIDANRKFLKPFRIIFGKTTAPVGITPLWVKEGTAVYEETVKTEAGRGRASYSEMLIRTAILEDKFPPIDRASVYHWKWPSANVGYIFGGKFILYLVQTYGLEKFLEFNRRIQSSLMLSMINHQARNVYGKTFYELWREWQKTLQEKYNNEAQELMGKGLTPTQKIVVPKWDEEFDNPALSPDGAKLAYSSNSPHKSPELRLKDLETGKDQRLAKQRITSISWSQDGKKIAYSASSKYKKYNYYNDLWLYDLETKKKERLTTGQRARDPSFSPDNKQLIFVKVDGAQACLKMLNLETKEITDFSDKTEEPKYVNFAQPKFSPDGMKVAVTSWKPSGLWKIYIYDLNTKKAKRLTKGTGLESYATWSSNGEYVYYSSDQTGIANIYRTNLKTGKTEQLTNVLTGVFKPSTIDGKKIYVQEYNKDGFFISSFEADVLAQKKISFELKPTAGQKAAVFGKELELSTIGIMGEPPTVEFKPKKYSPFGKSLFLPRFIAPYLAYIEDAFFFSFLTGGTDPLNWHNWLGGVTYRTDAEYIGYFAQYWYARLWPSMGLGINDYAVDFGDLTFNYAGGGSRTVHYYEKRRNAFAFIAFPISKFNFSTRFFYEDRMPQTTLTQAEQDALNLGIFSGFHASLVYSDANRYPASISPEGGRIVKLNGVVTDSVFGSAQRNEQQIFSGDWREYIHLWHHHVLGLRAAGGITWGDQFAQGTFGLGGDVGEGNLAQGGSYNYFPLRGLPVSAFSRTRALLLSAEYRIPLVSPQRGIGTWPFFINNIHAAIFADYGNAWNAHENDGKGFFDDFMLGVGSELRGDFLLGHGLPVTGRLGYAIIVVNRDRLGNLQDPILRHALKYGMLILQVGTSF
ncbi:MAG: DPP IV N-terminal domain-containing protein [Pseudomonadota bacterium]